MAKAHTWVCSKLKGECVRWKLRLQNQTVLAVSHVHRCSLILESVEHGAQLHSCKSRIVRHVECQTRHAGRTMNADPKLQLQVHAVPYVSIRTASSSFRRPDPPKMLQTSACTATTLALKVIDQLERLRMQATLSRMRR